LRGDPADNVRSPLAEPGVAVAPGDLVVAVNRRVFEKGRPFLAAFENLGDKDVVLTVRSGQGGAPRDVVVHTLADDTGLRYADWVRRNREHVAEATGGKIGYIHIPDMGNDGMIAFDTWFRPQIDKEGLVVDARWNRGGNVSEIILERLRRHVLTFTRARGGTQFTYPVTALNGPFVVLANEFSGSDGDIFPAAVKLEGLAPVIGQRTWGGVVGCRCADKPMVDGGLLTQPEFAWNDPRGGWTIENHGVDPDIPVQTLPQELAKGVDAQLDRAIAEVMKLRAAHPPVKPNYTAVRPRSRQAFEHELAR
jgi:tricorn protease